MLTITRSQLHALAWAALFTEANLEGYAMGEQLIVGSANTAWACMRFARQHGPRSERWFLGPDGKQHLSGGMVPTGQFKKLFAQRLKRLGVVVVNDPPVDTMRDPEAPIKKRRRAARTVVAATEKDWDGLRTRAVAAHARRLAKS